MHKKISLHDRHLLLRKLSFQDENLFPFLLQWGSQSRDSIPASSFDAINCGTWGRSELTCQTYKDQPQSTSSSSVSVDSIGRGKNSCRMRADRSCIIAFPVIAGPDGSFLDFDFSQFMNVIDRVDENLVLVASKLADRKPAGSDGPMPNRLIVLMLGRGSTRKEFDTKYTKYQKNLRLVSIKVYWLTEDEFHPLLSISDLGICCNILPQKNYRKSKNSPITVPIEIFELMRVGVPVVSFGFPSLETVISHGCNGFLYREMNQLEDLLCDLFVDFPKSKNGVTTISSLSQEINNSWNSIERNWHQLIANIQQEYTMKAAVNNQSSSSMKDLLFIKSTSLKLALIFIIISIIILFIYNSKYHGFMIDAFF